MILRKPYAILIKYFRLIHIVMFLFFGYFVFVFRKIYLFFSEYIKNGSFTYYENMTSTYVPVILFFITIILLALSIGIFFLMNKKEKPVLFYKVSIGYCSIVLIALIYFFAFFKSLDDTVYEPLRVVVNRDVILFLYLVNFFFVAVSFIRGFGFDIKKFSFDRDKRELNLEESDSEEYELNVKIEKDDIKAYINRQKRELKYYFKQNALFYTIVGVIAFVSIGLYLYYDIFVINKVYSENDEISVGGLVYKVNSSSIAEKDKYGQVISEDSEYLIINFSVINYDTTGQLDEQALRVHINEEYYYPNSASCDLFSDIGTCYTNQELKEQANNNYILVYKIPKDYKRIFLEILRDKGDEYQYNRILLSYKKYEVETVNLKMNESFKINDNEYKITKYEILPKTNYEYEECIKDSCRNYIKNVIPGINNIVLALNIDNLEKLTDDFLNSSFSIEYNNTKILGKDIKMIDRHSNTVYYSIPNKLQNVSGFTIIVTTRTKIYNISVEGGNSE